MGPPVPREACTALPQAVLQWKMPATAGQAGDETAELTPHGACQSCAASKRGDAACWLPGM
jgi:hypothetical protein